jgi:hypothetical protein
MLRSPAQSGIARTFGLPGQEVFQQHTSGPSAKEHSPPDQRTYVPSAHRGVCWAC